MMADVMPTQRGNVIAGAICALMLILFAVLAWSACTKKCATADEPLHAGAGWMHWRYGDYRVDPEDPPLFEYWAMLVQGRDALKVDLDDPLWKRLPVNWQEHGDWCAKTLFLTPPNDGKGFIERSRMTMLVLGVGLGLLIIGWAWKLAGAAAGVSAAVLYGLDPNFLAHAPLVKNDVPFSLVLAGAVMMTWLVGRRATLLRLIVLGLLVGAALTVKFSGVMVGPIVAVLLLGRALFPSQWVFLGFGLD